MEQDRSSLHGGQSLGKVEHNHEGEADPLTGLTGTCHRLVGDIFLQRLPKEVSMKRDPAYTHPAIG